MNFPVQLHQSPVTSLTGGPIMECGIQEVRNITFFILCIYEFLMIFREMCDDFPHSKNQVVTVMEVRCFL